jgi:hypothetical protein
LTDNVGDSGFSVDSGSIYKTSGKMTDSVKSSETEGNTRYNDMEFLGQVPVDKSGDVVPSSEECRKVSRHGQDEKEHCRVKSTSAGFGNDDTQSESGSIPRFSDVLDQF